LVDSNTHLNPSMNMCTSLTDCDILRDRVREQQQALADLAIERRQDKLTITLLRLQAEELEARVGRMQHALAKRDEERQALDNQLQRALKTARGAQRELAELRAAGRSR
jgi:chromosome segregation ATPase